jgi:hypothetical protein
MLVRLGLFAAIAISKSLEFGLTPEGMLKVGESRPGVKKGKSKSFQNGVANGSPDNENTSRNPYVAAWFYDALEVAHTMRGLKWKFGQGIPIPQQTRPLERVAFIDATTVSFIKNFLLLDLLESCLKLFPGVGTPMGGTIFYPNLSPITRFVVSTIIHILTGSAILAGFGMVYDLVTLFAVGVMDSSPLSWPPVMDHPWSSDSMHKFWSKDWHQLLRQTFLVFGGYPGKWLAGNIGMLFGTFLASGLFHECAMYSMGRGFDHSPAIFFAAQGPVLILERLWKKVTGRNVQGTAGRLWVYFIMFVAAQPMGMFRFYKTFLLSCSLTSLAVNAWHRRGFGGGMVIPPPVSPARWIILPLLKKLVTRGS